MPQEVTISEDMLATVSFASGGHELAGCATDMVYLYAYCPAMGEGCMAEGVYRRRRVASVQLPEGWCGCEVHLYLFAQNDLGQCSITAHIASTIPALSSAENAEQELVDNSIQPAAITGEASAPNGELVEEGDILADGGQNELVEVLSSIGMEGHTDRKNVDREIGLERAQADGVFLGGNDELMLRGQRIVGCSDA